MEGLPTKRPADASANSRRVYAFVEGPSADAYTIFISTVRIEELIANGALTPVNIVMRGDDGPKFKRDVVDASDDVPQNVDMPKVVGFDLDADTYGLHRDGALLKANYYYGSRSFVPYFLGRERNSRQIFITQFCTAHDIPLTLVTKELRLFKGFSIWSAMSIEERVEHKEKMKEAGRFNTSGSAAEGAVGLTRKVGFMNRV